MNFPPFLQFLTGEITCINIGMRYLLQVIEFKNNSLLPVSWPDYEFWLSHSFGPRLSSVPASPVNLLSCLFARLSLVSHDLPLILLPCALSILPPHFLCSRQCPRKKKREKAWLGFRDRLPGHFLVSWFSSVFSAKPIFIPSILQIISPAAAMGAKTSCTMSQVSRRI